MIRLPNPDFRFEIAPNDDEQILGYVDEKAIVNSGDTLTTLTLKAIDTHIEDNQAEGIIHVVEPVRLEMEAIDVTDYYN